MNYIFLVGLILLQAGLIVLQVVLIRREPTDFIVGFGVFNIIINVVFGIMNIINLFRL